jgi:hypothetical protein
MTFHKATPSDTSIIIPNYTPDLSSSPTGPDSTQEVEPPVSPQQAEAGPDENQHVDVPQDADVLRDVDVLLDEGVEEDEAVVVGELDDDILEEVEEGDEVLFEGDDREVCKHFITVP